MRFTFPSVERQKISDRITKTFAVGPGGLLNLKTNIGSIFVNGGERSDVCVEVLMQIDAGSSDEAVRNLKDLQLNCAQNGNDVEIHSEFHRLNGRLSVEFHVSVPRNYNVKLKSGAGNISIDGMEGETAVRTGGGSITIEHVKGAVVAQTSGGSIRIEDLVGEIEATTNGGNVAARISNHIIPDCYLTTSAGKVIVEVDQASSFDIDAQTRAGSIVTEFPITMQGKLKSSSCKSSINGGGPKLVLRSSAGDIHLRKLN